MGDSDNTATFLLRFKKDSGELVEFKEQLAGVGDTAKKSGGESKDGIDKMTGAITNLGTKLIVFDLLKGALRDAAASSDALSSLKGAISDTSKELIASFEPALSKSSGGLQAILQLILAIAAPIRATIGSLMDYWNAAFSMLTGGIGAIINVINGDFRGAWETLKGSVKEGVGELKNMKDEWKGVWTEMQGHLAKVVDTAEGKLRHMAEEEARLAAESNANREIHYKAKADLVQGAIEFELSQEQTGYERKLDLLRQRLASEADEVRRGEELKADTLKIQHEAGQLSEEAYNLKRVALAQQTADALAAIKQREAQDEARLAAQRQKNLESYLQKEMMAVAKAGAARYKETQSVGEALKAAGAQEVTNLSIQAAEYITIQGAKAAAAAFAHGAAMGGFPAGAAAAIATFASYASIAAVVMAGGSALSGAISGGGGSEPSGGSEGGGYSGGNSPTALADIASGSSRGSSITINISGADMLNNEKAARMVAEEIKRLERS